MARAKSASTKGAGTVTKKTSDKAKAKGGSTTKAKSASSAPRGKAAPAKKAAAKKAAPAKKAAAKKAAPAKKSAPAKSAKKAAPAKRSAPAKASAKAAEKKAPAKKAPAKAAEKAPAKAAKAAEKAPEKRAPEKKAAAPKRPEAVPAKTPPAAKRPIPAKRNKPAPAEAEAKPVVQVSSARPSIPPEDDPKFDNVPPLPEGLRVHPDSELGEKQAAYLYAALLAERERVTQGMGRHIAAAIGEGQPMAEEMDMAQRHAEQAYLMRFADKERKLLREIDHALAKFREGEYGICEGTGEPISYRRLELRPWTRYSVEFKEQIEREKRQHR